ncbi:NUDIX hydrolase [Nocardioides sp. Bht2]|uniref:NUDIX hydrolase n=1 Tax=Nocardioides sp. Bht2 TaxID=3392297 RepID=UPI0039B3728F
MTDHLPELTDGTVTLSPSTTEVGTVRFTIARNGEEIGAITLRRNGSATGELTWHLDAAHRGRGSASIGVRLVTDWALTDAGLGGLGLGRIECRVAAENEGALRVATRAGLIREGVSRQAPGHGEATEIVVLARISTDPPVNDPQAFRSLLNSFLPRKRAIGQMLIRDTEGRVLLCHLTYKRDWDLPGGVVEVGESPHLAASREIEEELALTIPAGEIVLTDWLPPWGGWDDAVCLVFDGGVHSPGIVEQIQPEAREIRGAEFLTVEQIDERAADFTARRIKAALAALDGGPRYTESGRRL